MKTNKKKLLHRSLFYFFILILNQSLKWCKNNEDNNCTQKNEVQSQSIRQENEHSSESENRDEDETQKSSESETEDERTNPNQNQGQNQNQNQNANKKQNQKQNQNQNQGQNQNQNQGQNQNQNQGQNQNQNQNANKKQKQKSKQNQNENPKQNQNENPNQNQNGQKNETAETKTETNDDTRKTETHTLNTKPTTAINNNSIEIKIDFTELKNAKLNAKKDIEADIQAHKEDKAYFEICQAYCIKLDTLDTWEPNDDLKKLMENANKILKDHIDAISSLPLDKQEKRKNDVIKYKDYITKELNSFATRVKKVYENRKTMQEHLWNNTKSSTEYLKGCVNQLENKVELDLKQHKRKIHQKQLKQFNEKKEKILSHFSILKLLTDEGIRNELLQESVDKKHLTSDTKIVTRALQQLCKNLQVAYKQYIDPLVSQKTNLLEEMKIINTLPRKNVDSLLKSLKSSEQKEK